MIRKGEKNNMKLKDACDIGLDCGLETTGEAVMNIELHAISIFNYDQIPAEIAELRAEYSAAGDVPIQEYLKKEGGN